MPYGMSVFDGTSPLPDACAPMSSQLVTCARQTVSQHCLHVNDCVHGNGHVMVQAMDRAHRIGQTNPVLVFRLATAHSVEGRLLQRANSKLMLERLVIKQVLSSLLPQGHFCSAMPWPCLHVQLGAPCLCVQLQP